MSQLTVNTALFAIILWYCLFSAPLTYAVLKFIAHFVSKHRERLEHRIDPKLGAGGIFDELASADSAVSPGALFVAGWRLLPVCAFMAALIVWWYLQQTVDLYYEAVTEADS